MELSQLDKTRLAADIAQALQERTIPNTGTLIITVSLTAGTQTETTTLNNSWSIQTT